MIYDHISNIERYRDMGAIYEGLKYLATMDADTAEGSYPICEKAKAGVNCYITKVVNPSGYETHNKMIDIQYLLEGEEKIRCTQRNVLTESAPYDQEKDYTLYPDDNKQSIELNLGKGFFAILYPNDAHMPQLCTASPIPVKKVVVKVEV